MVTRTIASADPVIGEPAASYGAAGSALEQRAAYAHNWQWNVSLQQEIFPNTVLVVAYVDAGAGARVVALFGFSASARLKLSAEASHSHS